MPTRTPFGKYDLLEKVASGGMAEVWRARLRDGSGGGEILAVKRILPAIAADHNFITMFLNEARIAVQLSHPGVVQIRDLGEIDGSYFLAMEYVAGQNLRAFIDRTRGAANSWQLPLIFASYVVQRIASALDYVHRKKDADGRSLNIVHRDVTPENVLVSYDGQVKLVDFGIAKAATASNMTRAGLIKGKLAYLSPEQSRGLALDGRSDIFSLGAAFYELLTGLRVFLGDSEYATVMNVRERPIQRPSLLRDRIPPELDAIVLKALTRDLAERYATAGEMAADLEVFLLKQVPFGPEELATLLRDTFPEEWATEQRVTAELSPPPPRPPPPVAARPLPVARPGVGSPTIRDMPDLGEPEPTLTEPARRAVQLPLPPPVAPDGLPPPGRIKRASSIKTMLIPLLRITGVHRAVSNSGEPTDRSMDDRVPTDKAMPAVGVPRRASLLPWLWALVGASGAGLAIAAYVAPRYTHRVEKGFLVVNASSTQAVVTLDGKRQPGPVPVVVELPAGLHEVEVEAPGFSVYHSEVVVEAGGQATLDAELVAGGK